MAAVIYAVDLSAGWKKNLPGKVADLFGKLNPEKIFAKRDLVAVKIHFGEAGNTAHIRPQLVRPVIEKLKEIGAKPFLTDTNTLYAGSRTEAWSHLNTAFDNGFNRDVVRAPVIIADGLRGNNKAEAVVKGKHISTAHLAADIYNSDGLVVLTHFKGHEVAGFGGALKNIGMGCASREGKLEQHSNIAPKISAKKCVGCGECQVHCHGQAIELTGEPDNLKAHINPENCIGCAECILSCPQGAVQVQWNESIPIFMEKMVEYGKAVLDSKKNKALFITFLTDVSPLCDCYPFSDRPIVPGIGILAGTDPVAMDQAAVDLVNKAPGNVMSSLEQAHAPGEDKFKCLFPHVDWKHQLEYAQEIGMGMRSYTLEYL